MKIKYFLFSIFTIVLSEPSSSSDSSFLSDDEDFSEASGDLEPIDQLEDEIVFSTIADGSSSTFTSATFTSIHLSTPVVSEGASEDSNHGEVTGNTNFLDSFENEDSIPNLESSVKDIKNGIQEGTLEPVEKLKDVIMEERNEKTWDLMKWVTFASVILGFVLICATFALLIHR